MAQASTVEVDAGPSRRSAFRPDVEGLRAIAILAVVGYHAGLGFLPGGFVGVDVFFVISGFLITGLLVTEVARTGRVSLSRFWARRARRLLPAATVVIVVTAIVGWLVVPVVDHQTTGFDLTSSALYVANMRFAFQATDYLTQDAAPSPALHFWSLGVEEQFYVVWPLLILLVLWLVHRRWSGREGVRRHLPTVLAVALGLLGVVSFALSLRLTDRVQPWAFFGMPSRAWEFAIGGLLAIAVPLVSRIPRVVRGLVGIVGLVLLLGSIVRIDANTAWPGTAAIWPVLGTALVIASGVRPDHETGRLLGVPGLMATRPMRLVGRLSYSWYLWHWPVLVLGGLAVGGLRLRWSVLLALLSLVPAAVVYRWIEQPVRHSRVLAADTPRSLRLGATLSAIGAVAGLLLATLPGGGALAASTATPPSVDAEGAGRPVVVPTPGVTSTPAASPVAVTWPPGPLTPAPRDIRDDIPVVYSDGCHLANPETTQPECAFGDTSSSTTVVIIGDSHAAQWFPAMDAVAKKNGWRLLSWTKSGCPAPDVTIFQRKLKRAYDECDTWRSAVLKRLTTTEKPALVVLTGTRTESLVSRADGSPLEGTGRAGQEWKDGYQRTITRLTAAGVPVAVLRDTPWPGKDMAVCVGQHESDPSACDLPLSALDDASYDVGVAAALKGAEPVDLDGLLCTSTGCPATLGRYVVYRDGSHLTATMAAALAPYLSTALSPLVTAP